MEGFDEYDALDEALMETFPASDPIAVSAPTRPSAERAREAKQKAVPSLGPSKVET